MGLQGLPGVTKGYRLQGVTREYKELQRVTEGNKGSQGVASGYTRLQ